MKKISFRRIAARIEGPLNGGANFVQTLTHSHCSRFQGLFGAALSPFDLVMGSIGDIRSLGEGLVAVTNAATIGAQGV